MKRRFKRDQKKINNKAAIIGFIVILIIYILIML